MQVNREEFLNQLECVKPGLSPKEIIEQSGCFVFQNGLIRTYNDEVACSIKTSVAISGAVKAGPLLNMLSKFRDEEIRVEQNGKEVVIRGRNESSGFQTDQEINLPLENVEIPKSWKPLPENFGHAVDIVKSCASQNASEHIGICVHLAPGWLEATDDIQLARYPLKEIETKKGKQSQWRKDSVLVKAASLAEVVDSEPVKWSETDAWIHFKNKIGLVVSCRVTRSQYPDIGKYLDIGKTSSVTLPKDLTDAVEKAQICSEHNIERDMIEVILEDGALKIRGVGVVGWYRRKFTKIKYKGKRVRFLIVPKIFADLAGRYSVCKIGKGKMKVDAGGYQYVTCIDARQEKESKPKSKSGKPKSSKKKKAASK